MKYRFKLPYMGFNPGDAVPDTYTPGVVDALLTSGRIEKQLVDYDNKQYAGALNK